MVYISWDLNNPNCYFDFPECILNLSHYFKYEYDMNGENTQHNPIYLHNCNWDILSAFYVWIENLMLIEDVDLTDANDELVFDVDYMIGRYDKLLFDLLKFGVTNQIKLFVNSMAKALCNLNNFDKIDSSYYRSVILKYNNIQTFDIYQTCIFDNYDNFEHYKHVPNKKNYIIISRNIKSIPDNAFYGCKELKGIQMHDDIEYIGCFAFSLTGLTKIKIPSNIKNCGLLCFGMFKDIRNGWVFIDTNYNLMNDSITDFNNMINLDNYFDDHIPDLSEI